MLNKNDPLIGVVQEVMKKNQAERDAAKLVNEKFGITDRKALPHERQGEWDAAYKSVLTEGINVPDVSYKKTEKNGNSDRTIMTKDTKNVFSGGTTTYQNVDKNVNKSGSDSLTTKIKSQDLGKNKELGGKDYNISTSTVYKSEKVNEEELDEMMIKVNMKHGADHSRLEAKHNVKIVKPEDPKGKHIIQGSKENLRKFADNVYDNYSPVNIHPELYKDEKPLKEASLAGLAPPFEKTTRKDILVGRGVLKKHPTQPGKHVLAKEELSPKQKLLAKVGKRLNKKNNPKVIDAEDLHGARKGHASHIEENDTTSPSAMGINKPDYATGTPDYAKSKEQTVNRAAKSSLPAGTVAKNIKEEAVSKAQHRFFGLVRGIQTGEARGSANAKKVAASMSPKSVKDYAKTKEKGLPEKVSEAVLGAQIRGQTSYGTNQSPAANLNKPSVIPSGTNKNRADMGNATNGGPFQPAARPAVRPAAGTNSGVTRLNANSAARQQAAKIGNQAGGVNTSANAPRRGMGYKPAARTNDAITKLNSATAKPAAPVAPAAPVPPAAPAAPPAAPVTKNSTPVRKAAPAAARARGTPVTRMRQQRQSDKNNLVGPGNS